MNKFIILIVVIVSLSINSCHSGGSGGSSSSPGPAVTGHPSGTPTTSIAPAPGVTSGSGPTAGAVTLTMIFPPGPPPPPPTPAPTSGNDVFIYVYFIGSADQRISIDDISSPPGTNVKTYCSIAAAGTIQIPASNFKAVRIPGVTTSGGTKTFKITAKLSGADYPFIGTDNGPVPPPSMNSSGYAVTTYTDGTGNQAVVMVVDSGTIP